MSIDQGIIVDGHVAKELLKAFAEDPDGFDEDTVEGVWEHLDGCEACAKDYEELREGLPPAERHESAPPPPSPKAGGEGSTDTRAFDPEDLESAKVEERRGDNGTHINGLIPVGDDPTRNGLPDEYRNGDRPPTVKIEAESPTDAAEQHQTDPEEGEAPGQDVTTVTDERVAAEKDTTPPEDAAETEGQEPPEPEDEEHDHRRPVLKAPEIDGLITGEVHKTEDDTERLETESALEAGERIKNESTAKHSPGGHTKKAPPAAKPAGEAPVQSSTPASDDQDAGEDDVPTGEAAVESEPAPRPPRARPATARPATARPAATRPATARPTGAVRKKPEPLEDLVNGVLASLARPRNAIIAGSVLILIAAAIITAVLFSGNETERLVAGWEPLDVVTTRVPLQEVLMRHMYRGRIPKASGTDVTLDFRGVDRLVIAVDLDFIKGKTSLHEVIVRNPAGLNVYQEPIPQEYLDDGRFFLRLVPGQFEENKNYRLEIVTYRADESMMVVAESVFDVVK
jgi:hypothetical protein